MMYSVGDKVVHPGHGPGVVRGVEFRQVIVEEKQYYVVEMLTGGTTLMTPVAKAEQIGLRLAVSGETLERLLSLLSEPPEPLPGDFRQRQNAIEERLKQSDVFVTTAVLRDLTWHGHSNGLTKRDRQLLQRAEELVGSELALIREIEVKAAIEQLQAIVGEAIQTQEDEN
jgi:CarD family transcriptional regulator